ncbi:MAG: hypothetical protein HPY90_07880 [Syntrophothermus sp.]|uniref:hypothetical protein n=1 Tax=Syntrophothermus sp. TaxID=2736299 RepID=UPI00257DC74A|nr:hypothetical protein [Syntrophothermus sp.]NSW83180.1 hypothetical protein [Syntrophothermus sp.]
MGVREELLKIMETLNEEDLEELLEYARWLQADKFEELTKEEYRELEEAEAEVARGEVVPWRAIRRTKVSG